MRDRRVCARVAGEDENRRRREKKNKKRNGRWRRRSFRFGSRTLNYRFFSTVEQKYTILCVCGCVCALHRYTNIAYV